MKHRFTPILLVSAFLIVGGIFFRATFLTTFERTLTTLPHHSPQTPTAPNLRVAPPNFQPDVPQDSPRREPNHSTQSQSPK